MKWIMLLFACVLLFACTTQAPADNPTDDEIAIEVELIAAEDEISSDEALDLVGQAFKGTKLGKDAKRVSFQSCAIETKASGEKELVTKYRRTGGTPKIARQQVDVKSGDRQVTYSCKGNRPTRTVTPATATTDSGSTATPSEPANPGVALPGSSATRPTLGSGTVQVGAQGQQGLLCEFSLARMGVPKNVCANSNTADNYCRGLMGTIFAVSSSCTVGGDIECLIPSCSVNFNVCPYDALRARGAQAPPINTC